jgi:RimK family alpha-L-glutamate ligase
MGAMERLVIIARNANATNLELLGAAETLGLNAVVMRPEQAVRRLGRGDVALGRLDVLPTLDGPEPGLSKLRTMEERGVLVLNRAGALSAAHDKLVTALRLSAREVPHPRTAHIDEAADLTVIRFPLVVKPRFGSWGHDVMICRSRFELERCLLRLRRRRKSWFRHQGALVQELIQPQGYDLRILVAAGEVVGAVRRIAAPGEWRTNVALGGVRTTADPPAQARLIALGAAAALGADLVGVDLLPDGNRGWVVLEVNGAVDFTDEYSLDGENVFEHVLQVLARAVRGEIEAPGEHLGRISEWAAHAAAIAGTAEGTA